jgi:hypothetical protein
MVVKIEENIVTNIVNIPLSPSSTYPNDNRNTTDNGFFKDLFAAFL